MESGGGDRHAEMGPRGPGGSVMPCGGVGRWNGHRAGAGEAPARAARGRDDAPRPVHAWSPGHRVGQPLGRLRRLHAVAAVACGRAERLSAQFPDLPGCSRTEEQGDPYDRARRYDAWFVSPWGSYAWAVESRLVRDGIGDVAGRRVLDVGCGTGRAGALLHALGACVVGADPDPARIAIARARVDAAVVAAGERLPFPDRCFDAALAVAVLEFASDPARVLGEMARVTRGAIVVGVLNPASLWGELHRRRSPAWRGARLVGARDLVRLCSPYGVVSVAEGLRAPGPLPGLAAWGPAWERLGRALRLPGAFRVARIERR